MSTSTMPKSIDGAAHRRRPDGGDSSTNADSSSRERLDKCRDFINRYRQLPEDFLRIPASYYQLQAHQEFATTLPHAIQGQLVDMIDISVVEAQLVKNYGLLRMDLYCKIRVGHMVCETQTCPNGAKNPKWDGVYQFSLKPGIDSFHLEIFDEKQFSLDEKIAWLYERIPPEVFQGITVERWFPLSGRLGPNKEGSVLLVISHKRVPMRAPNFGRPIVTTHQRPHSGGPPITVFVPAPNQPQIIGGPTSVIPGHIDPQVPTYIQPMQPPPPPTTIEPAIGGGGHVQTTDQTGGPISELRQASEQDINQLSEMFPSIDKAIIKAILENNNHDKEAAIGALLAMG